MGRNPFGAAPSAAGYLYQARLALYRCMPHLKAGLDLEVSIERLDDVAFASGGDALELLQAKHHVRRTASLTDASSDLWKTLRVWADQVAADPGLPSRVKLLLVTTADAPKGSVAAMLRPGSAGPREMGEVLRTARDRLLAIAEASSNRELRPAFDAFTALTDRLQLSLLSAIEVLDGRPSLVELEAALAHELRMSAPNGQADAAREMLEGWWWPRICRALMADPPESIPLAAIEARLDEISEQLKRNALVADFEFAEPTTAETEGYDELPFVGQLRAVGLGANRLSFAKQDFYRAFAQRSRWTRQHVVLDEELERFERMLIEEWRPRHAAMCDAQDADAGDELRARRDGQDLYAWVETSARFPFRNLTAKFLNVGSYHMLANEIRIGWHRDYLRLFGAGG